MTVRELIAELSKHPPDAEVRLKTADISTDIESVEGAVDMVKIFGVGWDDDGDYDTESDFTCGGCGEAEYLCVCSVEESEEKCNICCEVLSCCICLCPICECEKCVCPSEDQPDTESSLP